nr:hypothetical protein [Kitasatospora aureofaciens]
MVHGEYRVGPLQHAVVDLDRAVVADVVAGFLGGPDGVAVRRAADVALAQPGRADLDLLPADVGEHRGGERRAVVVAQADHQDAVALRVAERLAHLRLLGVGHEVALIASASAATV